MSRSFFTGLVGLVAATLLVAMTGCSRPTTTRSTLTAGFNGREVKVMIDGPASITSERDAAVVTFGGHKLRVEKERILLDSKELAKLPAGAKKVELEYTAGKLTATADGTALEIAGPPK